MMKYCNRCDKKGMHGYRIFLWIVLAVIVVAGIWYVICGCKKEIPTDGTLVDDMKKGYCNCKEDLANAMDDLCNCKEDAKSAMEDCVEDIKDNMEACCEEQETESNEA